MQIFSGYGENLIDYNHRQTTVGVGVSFFDQGATRNRGRRTINPIQQGVT